MTELGTDAAPADSSVTQVLVQGSEQPLPEGIPAPGHQLQAGSGVSMPAAPCRAEPWAQDLITLGGTSETRKGPKQEALGTW